MKILKLLVFVLAVVLCVSSFKSVPFKGKLAKAFDALSVYNYFDARELFYKSLKKHKAPASFGLAIIYERNDNPFHNLDSAFKYISTADSLYPLLEKDELSEYADLNASIVQVDSLQVRIDSLFFVKADKRNAIIGWKGYLSNHESEPYYSLALEELHALAFDKALALDNSDAYKDFIQNYSMASQVEQAEEKLEESIYREKTKSGLIVDYREFIREYPQNPYRREAEEIVYQKFTKDEKLESYLRFIEDNPNNPYVSSAWKKIYALEIKELSPRSIAAFTLKYPNYPYINELQDEYDLVATRYFPVFNGQKWGFIDESGSLKIAFKYDFVEPFKESLALVGVGDSVAYINKSGRFINDGYYEDGFSFVRGFAVVMTNGKYGAINRLGEWVVKPEYDDVGEFSGGMFYLLNDDLYGYANQNGDLVIEFTYADANDFMNDRAVVAINGQYGIINTDGELLSELKYDWIDGFESAGNPTRFRVGQKFGLLNNDGIETDSILYDQIGEFHEEKALFAIGEKYGFLNIYGDTAIDLLYSYSTRAFNESYFQKGYAKVFQDDKVAIVDSVGNKVFPAIFQDVGRYRGKLIPIKKRGSWGYADKEVNLAIPYQYTMAHNFVDSTAIVQKNGQYSLIDSLGNNLLDSAYTDIFYIGPYLAVKDSLYGLIDRQGQPIAPMVYSTIEKVDTHTAKLKLPGGKLDYYNYQTNQFIWRQD